MPMPMPCSHGALPHAMPCHAMRSSIQAKFTPHRVMLRLFFSPFIDSVILSGSRAKDPPAPPVPVRCSLLCNYYYVGGLLWVGFAEWSPFFSLLPSLSNFFVWLLRFPFSFFWLGGCHAFSPFSPPFLFAAFFCFFFSRLP